MQILQVMQKLEYLVKIKNTMRNYIQMNIYKILLHIMNKIEVEKQKKVV